MNGKQAKELKRYIVIRAVVILLGILPFFQAWGMDSMVTDYKGSDLNKGKVEEKLFHGYCTSVLEKVYTDSSQAIKVLLTRLQQTGPTGIQSHRFVTLVGPSGTGKTTASVMFAYKLGWEIEKKSAPELTGSGMRGKAIENLQNALKEMNDGEKPTIGILDEAQALFDHAQDKNYDADGPARELCTFLDDNVSNKKFFLVLTANDITTFAEPLKSRIKPKVIEFKQLVDPKRKIESFKKHLCRGEMQLHEDCTPQFLEETVGGLRGWSERDFLSLTEVVIDKFMKYEPIGSSLIIKKAYIEKAIKRINKATKIVKEGKEEDTDYKQRERHHEESVKLQLLSQSNQKSQKTVNVNGGVSFGVGGTGGNVGGGGSYTTAPGLSKDQADEIYEELFPGKKLKNKNTRFKLNSLTQDQIKGVKEQVAAERKEEGKDKDENKDKKEDFLRTWATLALYLVAQNAHQLCTIV